MASNSFGKIFRITTWGESHGRAIGVVIDGCPSGLKLEEEDIDRYLILRAPGKNRFTSPRSEADKVEIWSGVFEGRTTGAPISIIIFNKDADSTKYEPIKDHLRPGHANYTYLSKYGLFDYRGAGRASARETAARVAAGAVAKKLLDHVGIKTIAYLESVGSIHVKERMTFEILEQKRDQDPLFCPDTIQSLAMQEHLEMLKKEGDSIGGTVHFMAEGNLLGLGEPMYDKLESHLASAMMSIPATKSFEIGGGTLSSQAMGSSFNDGFTLKDDTLILSSNHAGGVLGGIANGMPIYGKVAFKPTSSIQKPQNTLNLSQEKIVFNLPEGSRHDPCVAIRGVIIVEAMLNLVLADLLLHHRLAKLDR